MTARNLDALVSPTAIALVGATDRPGSVGRILLESLVSGGFTGPILPVNPSRRAVLGLPCVARLGDLGEAPDLVVVAIPPRYVPGVIADAAAAGARAAVVVTAGLTEANGLRQAMLDAARPTGLRIMGPNTIGLLSTPAGINASFAHLGATRGKLALVSQSGAIVTSVLDWAAAEGVGFSHILSLGDMADIDVGDCLDMLATDSGTSAILLYLESVPSPRKFMSAARAASRLKPVIAIKSGRSAAAATAAATHTGALAGVDRVIDAALRRSGIMRVDDLGDLFTAAEITARYAPLRRARIGIVTNGGGAGVLAVDHLVAAGAELAVLGPETIAALETRLPATWSRANPVDIIGDAPADRYRDAVAAVAADAGVDALLVMNCPTALATPLDAARGVAALLERGSVAGKPVLACWLGKHAAEPARFVLEAAGAATFDTPGEAARAVALLTEWHRRRERTQRVPGRHAAHPDRAEVAAVLSRVAAEGRTLLTEPEAKAVVAAYGVPVPPTIVARSEAEVEDAARQLLAGGGEVAIKLLSRSITHKSDIGGVVLGIATPEAARQAAASIRERVLVHFLPDAIDGFSVQPMIRRPLAVETLVGVSTDPSFGPVLMFGSGGVAVEVLDDTATGLLPLDDLLAGDLIDATRVARLLAGYRGRPPADRPAIVATMLAVNQLAIDFPAIRAVDLNPLLADAEGVVALDARVEIDPALVGEKGPSPRLAIRPYPDGWEAMVETGQGQFLLRPIRPQDAELYPAFLADVPARDMAFRVLGRLREVTPAMLVRLTQLDYDREIAFVALDPDGQLAGVVRYAALPDRSEAEFAALVSAGFKGAGLGAALMRQLLAYARSQGIGALVGLTNADNIPMLALARELGFRVQSEPGEPGLMALRLSLQAP